MKAILLAGGKGTRISRYIGDQPKCTLDIGGISLIKHTVNLLNKNNIECNVVLGYKKDYVKNILKGMKVNYFYNPFYDVTNSISSLWFAKSVIKNEDIIILNADVYFDQNILDIIINKDIEQVMLMDSSRKSDYLFICKEDKLIKHGKDLINATAEYVGIAKIRLDFVDKFVKRLEELIEDQNHGMWWENVMYSFIEEHHINVQDINGLFWSEIDFIEDYNRIVSFRKESN